MSGGRRSKRKWQQRRVPLSAAIERLEQRSLLSVTPPLASIVAIKGQTDAPLRSVDIRFSSDVTGVDIGDFVLTRNGMSVSLAGASLAGGGSSYTLQNLEVPTGQSGAYVFSLDASIAGISNSSGLMLQRNASASWTAAIVPPAAVFGAIASVTASPLAEIEITFSKPVTGLDAGDFTLYRDGEIVDLSSAAVFGAGSRFTLGNLAPSTSRSGSYLLTLHADLAGIVDAAGNRLSASVQRSWTATIGPPAATIAPVLSPRTAPVESVDVIFSKPVNGLDLGDFTLSVDGVVTSLAGATLIGDGRLFSLGNLAGVTSGAGSYSLGLHAAFAGVSDAGGNRLIEDAAATWTTLPALPESVASVVPWARFNPISVPVSAALPGIAITLDTPVPGLDTTFFSLERDGVPVSLAASAVMGSGTGFSLIGLNAATAVRGRYTLTMFSSGRSARMTADETALPRVPVASVQWMNEAAGSRASLQLTPGVPPGSGIAIAFDAPIMGLDIGAFALTRDGVPVSLSGAVLSGSGTGYTLALPREATGVRGQYVLSLDDPGKLLVDAAGNTLQQRTTISWFNSASGPRATFQSPARTPWVSSVNLTLNVPVTGLDVSDFTLTRDGMPVSLSSAVLSGTGMSYTLGGLLLPGMLGGTNQRGVYVLTLNAAGSGVADGLGNSLLRDASVSWANEIPPTTVSFNPISPIAGVQSVSGLFDIPVLGLDIGDFTLTRDGVPVSLTNAVVSGGNGSPGFSIQNLAALTAAKGVYVLSLNPSRDGILDSNGSLVDYYGNPVAAMASVSWANDPPSLPVAGGLAAAWMPITTPTTAPVPSVSLTFAKLANGSTTQGVTVSGLDLGDFTLTRDGLPIPLVGASLTVSNGVYTLNNMQPLTARSGNYVLTLNAAASGIADLTGTALTQSAAVAWTARLPDLAARFLQVPSVVTSPLGSVPLSFRYSTGWKTSTGTPSVVGLDLSDFTLTRDGLPIPLTGATLTGSGANYTVGNLQGLASRSGNYRLSLNHSGSGIWDAAGNPLVSSATVAWTVSRPEIAAAMQAVRPSVASPATAVSLAFTVNSAMAAVTGLDLNDFVLTRDGVPVPLVGATLTGGNGTHTLGNLAPLNGRSGNYVLTLQSAGSGIFDAAGNALVLTASAAWTVAVPSLVASFDPLPESVQAGPTRVALSFSNAVGRVSGLDIRDFRLTRDGRPVPLNAAFVSGNETRFFVENLGAAVAAAGEYELTLIAAGAEVSDTGGNEVTADASIRWRVDQTAPAVNFTLMPDTGVVTAALVSFSEDVGPIALSGFRLLRDGQPVSLAAARLIGTGLRYVLADLAPLTAAVGRYELGVVAPLTDKAGNRIGTPSAIAWTQGIPDDVPPTVRLTAESPRQTNARELMFRAVFSEPVSRLSPESLVVENGLVTAIAGSGTTYLITVAVVAEGDVRVTLPAAAVRDRSGNPSKASETVTVTHDSTGPGGAFAAPAEPVRGPLSSIGIIFTEAVVGVDISQLSLTRDGVPVSLRSAALSGTGSSYTISQLGWLTATPGTYTLALNPRSTAPADLAGNVLPAAFSTSWTWSVPPTAVFSPVSSVRPVPVSSVDLTFSVPVDGVSLDDFTLRRNGVVVGLAGVTLSGGGSRYTIGNLDLVTGISGSYLLTLNAANAGIRAGDGSGMVENAVTGWSSSITWPTAMLGPVAPHRSAPLEWIEVAFNTSVTGLDINDFRLTRNGQPVSLASATLQGSGAAYVLGNLSAATAMSGSYVLSLDWTNAGIFDLAGNPFTKPVAASWNVTIPPLTAAFSPVATPRPSPFDSMSLELSGPVTGLSVAHFVLTRDGAPVSLANATLTGSGSRYTLGNLASVTALPGSYSLRLAQGPQPLVDRMGAPVMPTASAAWTTFASGLGGAAVHLPTASLASLPGTATGPVSRVGITFSEPVAAVDTTFFTLNRDGDPVSLAGAALTGSGSTFELVGLDAATARPGGYTLTLYSLGWQNRDALGMPIRNPVPLASTSWTNAAVGPRLTMQVPVQSSLATSVNVSFDVPVTGLDLGDFTLVRDGIPVSLAGATLTGSGTSYTIAGLAYTPPFASASQFGAYVLTLKAEGSGVVDGLGNGLQRDGSVSWANEMPGAMAAFAPLNPTGTVVTVYGSFDVSVYGLDIGNFTLTRDGVPVSLASASLSSANGPTSFTIGNLGGVTAARGVYVLTLDPSRATAIDPNGSLLDVYRNPVRGSSVSWVNDPFPAAAENGLFARFMPISTPTTAVTTSVALKFFRQQDGIASQTLEVGGLDLGDFTLTRDGIPIPLTGAVLATSNGMYTIGNIRTLTARSGNYVLTLNAAGSAVADAAGIPLTASTSIAWTARLPELAARFAPVSSQLTAPLSSVPLSFRYLMGRQVSSMAMAVRGLDLSDFTLSRDGVPIALSGATLSGGQGSFTVGNLQTLTGRSGNYRLTLNHSASGITDEIGNPLAAPATVAWTVNRPEVTAWFGQPVTPRNTNVASIPVSFRNASGAVVGFDTEDLVLTRDGMAVSLVSARLTGSGTSFVLDNLGPLTSVDGTYRLSLARGVPGASDSSGNSVADTASVTWTVDSFAPSVTLTPRTALLPTPTGTTTVVESIDIAFSESVTGFSLADLMLTRNGEPMSLVNARLTGSGSRFVLHGLDAVTASNGVYSLTTDPQAAAIADLAGNPMRSAGGFQWTQGGRDTTQPTVMLASRAPQIGANGQHTVVATFSEPVAGLPVQAISVINGTLTNLAGTGGQYTFTVTAIADGPVVVTVPANATVDAALNPNLASNTLLFAVDRTSPTVQIGGVSQLVTTSIGSIDVVFSEPVSGLSLSHFMLVRDGGPVGLAGATLVDAGARYTLTNLDLPTGVSGRYTLSFAPPTGLVGDLAGNGLTQGATLSWAATIAPPQASFSSVTSGRSSPVDSVEIVFSRPVTGFDINDLRLMRNGVQVSLLNATLTGSGDRYLLGNLAAATGQSGAYSLVLDALSARVADLAGNPMRDSAVTAWTASIPLPVATFATVATPRPSAVDSVDLAFTVPVTGVNLADFQLLLDGNAMSLAGATLTGSGNRYTLGNLAKVTGRSGSYTLVLNPIGAGIADEAGNPLRGAATTAWSASIAAPVGGFSGIATPRNAGIDSLDIGFSVPVSGVDLSDFVLLRDGSPISLAAASLTGSGNRYTIGNLALPTGRSGTYSIILDAAKAGIADEAGNLLRESIKASWTASIMSPFGGFSTIASPRNAAVISVDLMFSVAVSGVDLSDFVMVRDGVPVSLASANLSGSGTRYTLSNLQLPSGRSGSYSLILEPVNSGITDAAGNSLTSRIMASWTASISLPTAAMTRVVAQTTGVESIEVLFSVPVIGVDVDEFELTCDWNPVSLADAVISGSGNRYVIAGLRASTEANGTYRLKLRPGAAPGGIMDAAGNPLAPGAMVSWFKTPAAQPRPLFLPGSVFDGLASQVTAGIPSIGLTFEAPVTGLDMGYFSLTRNGRPVSLAAADLQGGGSRYVVQGLGDATSPPGDYRLVFEDARARDDAPLAAQGPRSPLATYAWKNVGASQSARLDVGPLSAAGVPGSAWATFTAPVSGLDITDFSLVRDGVPVSLAGVTLLVGSEPTTSASLSNLAAVASAPGTYTLTLNPQRTGVYDLFGDALTRSASVTWTNSTPAASARLDVGPLSSAGVPGSVWATFTAPVSGLDITDFSLLRDGVPVSLAGMTLLAGSEPTTSASLSNLAAVASAPGTYTLTLNPQRTGVYDLFGDALTRSASVTWTNSTPAASARLDVGPLSAAGVPGSIWATFTAPVSGLDITDFSLVRDGVPVSLAGVSLLAGGELTISASLSNLAAVASAPGTYTLTLNPQRSGVYDPFGDALTQSASVTWTNSTPATSAMLRYSSLSATGVPNGVEVSFSAPVSGLDMTDFALTRDGMPVSLSGAWLSRPDGASTFALLGNLGSAAVMPGTYLLTLNPRKSGVWDQFGNPFVAQRTIGWSVAGSGGLQARMTPPVSLGSPSLVSFLVPATSLNPVTVTGVDIGDFTLARDGVVLSLAAATLQPGNTPGTFLIGNLAPLTSRDGTYVLSLNARNSGISDVFGSPLGSSASTSWTVDAPELTAMLSSPSSVGGPVTSLSVGFTGRLPGSSSFQSVGSVSGLDLSDFTLTCNGAPVSLAGATLSGSGSSFMLGNLAARNSRSGTYVLTLNARNTGILDSSGNPLGSSASTSWTVATPELVAVLSSPSSSGGPATGLSVGFAGRLPGSSSFQSVGSVSGVDLSDFTLTRDGAPVSLAGAVLSGSGSMFTLGSLASLSSRSGTYVLTLNARNSGIIDSSANSLTSSASASWTVAAPELSVVLPAPSNQGSPVPSLTLSFAGRLLGSTSFQSVGTIRGLDPGDFSLTRDGAPVSLAGAVLTGSGSSFTLGNLAALNSRGGSYVLTINARNSGVSDSYGSPLVSSASTSWTVAEPEMIAILPSTPVSGSPVNSMPLQFMSRLPGTSTYQPLTTVTGLDLGDFTLMRDGRPLPLAGATLSGSGSSWSIGNLAALNSASGTYELTLHSRSSAIRDASGNPLRTAATASWTVDMTAPDVALRAVRNAPDEPVSAVIVTFTENVRGMDRTRINLTRDGMPVNLDGLQISGSGSRYSLDAMSLFTAEAGDYVLSLKSSGRITDLAGNPLQQASVLTWRQGGVDVTSPDVLLTTSSLSPTRDTALVVAASFSEPVFGVNATSLNVTNGTVIAVQDRDTRYTFVVEPAGDGPVIVTLPQGMALDAAGNGNRLSNTLTIVSDRTAPTAAFIGVGDGVSAVESIRLRFSETVVGFKTSSLSLMRGGTRIPVDGAMLSWSGLDAVVSLPSSLTATDGRYEVVAALTGVTDLAGNEIKESARAAWSKFTPDTTRPSVILSAGDTTTTASRAVTLVASFSEPVAGFSPAAVTVTNGNVTSVTGAGRVFTVTVTPIADGIVTVRIPADAASDFAGNGNEASSSVNFTSDTTPSRALRTIMPSAGIYKAGSALQFSVQYDEPVVVGGTPLLSLLVGANARTATYVDGSGSDTLRFQYTVAAGESDPRGVIVTGGLSLPANASLRDQAGNVVSRVVPAVNASAVRVDAIAPVIVGVAIPRAATYGVGATLTVTVSFSKATIVRGTPTIPIRMGAITRQAAYVSGTGTATLVFRYTVVRGDTALTGIELGNSILFAAGASIEDAVGNAARLSFTPPSARTVRVFTARA